MNKMLLDHETILKAGKRAADMAKHGTREEQSGRFLPPAGWKGRLITGTPGELDDLKPRATDTEGAQPPKGRAA